MPATAIRTTAAYQAARKTPAQFDASEQKGQTDERTDELGRSSDSEGNDVCDQRRRRSETDGEHARENRRQRNRNRR
jgi:hypothetical protein